MEWGRGWRLPSCEAVRQTTLLYIMLYIIAFMIIVCISMCLYMCVPMCICMHMLWCMYEASGFQYLQNWRSRGPKLSRIQKITNCAISNFWAFREPQIPRIHGYPKLRSFCRNNVDSAVEGLEHFFGYALFWILLSFGYILDTVWIRYGYVLDTGG